ncbi:hypothetical protein QMT40_000518 [Parvibaculaceae bacterium PLY_AMNH_Bact1]|nr:hypothetical protein QMT40_000518 [Parvibaculaceae bacterium PLY_AMNH_Bact1]
MIVKFDEPDPKRAEKEAEIKKLDDRSLRKLYNETRAAARAARRALNMEELYRLVRGTKTIQRIAGERGMIIRSVLPRTVRS